MYYGEVQAGEFVFKQNDNNANCFFLIANGLVKVIINDKIKKTLSTGQSFGELALLFDTSRSASIQAICKT